TWCVRLDRTLASPASAGRNTAGSLRCARQPSAVEIPGSKADTLGYYPWNILLFIFLVLLPDLATLVSNDAARLLIPQDGHVHGGAIDAHGAGLDDCSARGRSTNPSLWPPHLYPEAVRRVRVSHRDVHSAAHLPEIDRCGAGGADAVAYGDRLCRRKLLGAHAGSIARGHDRQSCRMPEYRSECRRYLCSHSYRFLGREDTEF